MSIGMFVRARFETGLFRFPSGEPAHAAWLSRRLPGKLISAGSCGCASGGQPGMSAHPTAFRFSVRRYRTNPVFCRARPRGLPIKKVVNSRRRCVEARALPAGVGCRRPLEDGPLGPAPDLPDPAGELARHGGVGLARALARRGQRLAAAVEPGGAVVRPRAYRRGHVGAGGWGLWPRGARGVVPCGLYERRARERVAGLGYPAAPLGLVSVNLFFTSFAKQARRSRKGGFTGCANVFSPIPVTA